MSNIKYFDEYLNEKYHVDQDVRHLTKLIYDKINYYLPKLILNKSVLITNLLQNNYKNIKFKNDKIILNLGSPHGGINMPIYNNDTIENLEINLTIFLSKSELKNKYLFDNKIKEIINHECQHILEFYHTKGNLTKSWDFHARLKEHEDKYKEYDKWLEITHMFYLTEYHEMRSSISQLLEYLKDNIKDNKSLEILIKNSDIYQRFDFLSKINAKIILTKMRMTYPDFNLVLDDFIKNVIINNNSDIDNIFNREIKLLNKRAEESKRKLLRLSNNFLNEISGVEDRIIDYSEYIRGVADIRDDRIDEILNNPK